MHIHMYVCIYLSLYVCMHECMHACMYACMHVCMYLCMYVCKINAFAHSCVLYIHAFEHHIRYTCIIKIYIYMIIYIYRIQYTNEYKGYNPLTQLLTNKSFRK